MPERCGLSDRWRAGHDPEKHLLVSSVKSLLLNLRQITDKSALPLSPPTHSHLSSSSSPHADRLPAERLNLPLPLAAFLLSEKQPSPHNSQGKKVGDTITVNHFFLHFALPEASLELFTDAYKVLILPLLTVAYENSVYQRLAPDCAHHEIRFLFLFSFSSFLPLRTDRDEVC